MERCWWAGEDPLYVAYHDHEWGVPCRDDAKLFEMLLLESAQAGLAWITILRKRENYRRAFSHFDPAKIARYDKRKKERLLADAGIVRNRLKIDSAIRNARVFLDLRQEFGSFSEFLWGFVDGEPIVNRFRRPDQIPASTPLSDSLSKELKRRGMNFVGSTIVYAYMQSVGMVNDHLVDCPRHKEVGS
ncbi:MAG: DNA-3-methyladenine glycosylase I [Acidobacteria bacterium]|nr:DNA-3-methyladenine glycosylase I [Acidobacteriota bacterium]NIM62847.1 DNA-3-methyladenine glycosylase I [Acidobacteriota bacterium]NIO60477.1 DNA-3-methyladenine glycosylase I [Acidobacteriota bacterium]NIQ31583.1 DNA-3-methyladenine glycosylase I [Acidobacteriota bacterium]NIQ86833.1 DNA-3-methyladenine glycosylase I [Acidobacteriota bacterium]